MSAIRRKYTEEFRVNAVRLSHTSNRPVSELAHDFGIHEAMLYRRRTKYSPDGGLTPAANQEEELKRLRCENSELKLDFEMLKKATAYFARNQK